jgi:hypothetical protein
MFSTSCIKIEYEFDSEDGNLYIGAFMAPFLKFVSKLLKEGYEYNMDSKFTGSGLQTTQ